MDPRESKHLHDTIGFVGLRAHATAVGLIQLTTELVDAGVLDASALARVKEKIAQDLCLNRPAHTSKATFERQTRERLDRLFCGKQPLAPMTVAAGAKAT
ncbi:hypothetical protein KX816_06590 [Sphingosinicellaceae bacterium]|nr:hypothetical protein KX816_06590 [Sphingosinicellaceae bacterium]